jgi:general secretion pathway protein I
MKRARSGDRGFALLEAIVAMAIASLALSAIYRTVGNGLRAASRVQTIQSAVVASRSHLSTIGIDGTLSAGVSRGSYGNGLRWHLNVADMSARSTDENALRAYWITLKTIDRSGALLLELETAKIAREAKQ